TYKRWSDVTSLGIAPNGPDDGPIVPWTMDDTSGTRAAAISFLIFIGGAPSDFNPDTQTLNGGPCTHYLCGAPGDTRGDTSSAANQPRANDIKPLVLNHPLSTNPESPDNPENWIWFGSFGTFNAFPFTSKVTGLGGAIPSVAASFLPI